MKIKFVHFLTLLICCIGLNTAKAAFPLRTPQDSTTVHTPGIISGSTDMPAAHTMHRSLFDRIRVLAHPQDNMHAHHHGAKPGWPGIAALAAGAIGLSSVYLWLPFGILAIVFGIIGVGHKYKNKGLALAGLILGGLEILALALAVIIIASFL